ncbi:hypothetical protein KU306_12120 [Haloferax larsenii]|uniref:Uncharacterized protein n=1 Tax=Haloferax larsenii TaxID=302484 RepID=A0ABY5RDI8_HALLR|nr:hypothetical protein [Haloferax larsenii]UVE49650.1 hypothetical protein KU306_12120 [Haloferax larsenii]
MTFKKFVKQMVFIVVYVPFATAALIYLFSGGEFGAEAMVKAAVLPWWLPLIAVPPLLVLVFVGLSKLGLDESI